MLVFSGGFTSEQVEKLKCGDHYIYDKVPIKYSQAVAKNTFDYVPKELYGMPLHIFKRYIAEDVYIKQYIFFARYLSASLEFCINCEKKNYIMVCDIDEKILDNYIGVGKYATDYRREYRLPRSFVTSDNIVEFLYFEPYDKSQILEFKEKYKEHYNISSDEDRKAKQLMLERNLKFNEYKVIK